MNYQIKWDADGERRFEAGVSRGVLYYQDSESDWVGVPWNGLVSVTENAVGGEVTPYYHEGVKYGDVVASEDYQATVEAFTYPDEFDELNGISEIPNTPGVFATAQPRNKRFILCYRTEIGNDSDGIDHGYKIHIVYNCVATPTEKPYRTLADAMDLAPISWTIHASPETLVFGEARLNTIKPTAHFVIDSRDVLDRDRLLYLEDQLYGAPGSVQKPTVLGSYHIAQIFNESWPNRYLDGNPGANPPGSIPGPIDGNPGVGIPEVHGGSARHNF